MLKKMKRFGLVILMALACVLGVNPAKAATNTTSWNGYSIPATMTFKVGETKTLRVTQPTTSYANVSFGYSPTYVSASGYKAGSYWGKSAEITFKAVTKGTTYFTVTVDMHKSKTDKTSSRHSLTCKVNIVDKTSNAKPSDTKTEDTKTTVKSTEKYLNVSEAYTLLNKFRTTKSNQWYWNSTNKAKVKVTGLTALKRSSSLEELAKKRAKEQWTQLYVNHKQTHTRPNGKSCYSIYPNANTRAENLAWGHTSCKEVMGANGWAETYKNYAGQGHRRAMLDKRLKQVGIACYSKDGLTCWAMCLTS